MEFFAKLLCKTSHLVATLKFLVSELPSTPAATNNCCEIHSTSALRFYCKNCKISICDICWDENHEDESKHAVIKMKKYLQPQKLVQSKLGAYKTECNKLKDFLSQNHLTDIVNQVQNAERIQCEVLKSRTANEVEAKSNELKVALDAQMNQLKIFKSEMLSQFALLETSFESIFKEDKKRELVGFRETGKMNQSIECYKAAYDSNTRELFATIDCDGESFEGITVFGLSGDQNDQLQLKRTMKWKTLRGDETCLWDICLDTTSNSLYGVVLQEGNFKVEELDKLTLKKKSELDTEGLLNGNDIRWFLTSKSDTITLTIFDKRYKDNHKWHSVTMYKNRTRLYTVPLDMKTDLDQAPLFAYALVTETTLLLICRRQDNKVALVSLPAQTQQQHHTHASASSTLSSSTEPPIINYLIATGVKKIDSLFWISSGHLLHGYLFAVDIDSYKIHLKIFEVDLEKDFANVKHGQQQLTLRMAKSVSAPKSILPLCQIDHSTVFAMKTEDGNKINLLLLKLDFSDS